MSVGRGPFWWIRGRFAARYSVRDFHVACVSVRDLELGGDVNPAKTSSQRLFSGSRCYQCARLKTLFG
jgi:hypothetical protein